MRAETRIIPVAGISRVPGIADEVEDANVRWQKNELLLLNVATGLAITLVSCAWIAIALD